MFLKGGLMLCLGIVSLDSLGRWQAQGSVLC